MNIFKIKEGSEDNTWMVGLEDSVYKTIGALVHSGSYNIFAARVLGFTYPDYLRYVRTNFNATLKGREGYSYAYYKNRNDCYDIVSLLNKKWREVEDKLKKVLKVK